MRAEHSSGSATSPTWANASRQGGAGGRNTMTELVMGLGIVFGLAFHELVGRSPGGIVAPAYIAFFWDQPGRVAATLAVSLVTYGAVALAGRYLLLFGRRRTGLMLLVGFLLRWLWESTTVTFAPGTAFDAIGF